MLGGALPKAEGDAFPIPLWVIVLCAVTMGIGQPRPAAGASSRRWACASRRLEPIHGFAAETAAGLTIMIAGSAGVPLSTTAHHQSTTIMGVGSTRGLSAVKWGVAGSIVAAWIPDLPHLRTHRLRHDQTGRVDVRRRPARIRQPFVMTNI